MVNGGRSKARVAAELARNRRRFSGEVVLERLARRQRGARTRPIVRRGSRASRALVDSVTIVPLFDPAEATAAAPSRLVLQTVRAAVSEFARDQRTAERAIAALVPPDVPSSAAVEQIRRNADARKAFLEAVPVLDVLDVARIVRPDLPPGGDVAERLLADGRAFAVRSGDRTLFPAFQFSDDGEPLPGLSEALAHLRATGLEGWQLALWFDAEHEMLGLRRPAEALQDDPNGVVAAAAAEGEIPE